MFSQSYFRLWYRVGPLVPSTEVAGWTCLQTMIRMQLNVNLREAVQSPNHPPIPIEPHLNALDGIRYGQVFWEKRGLRIIIFHLGQHEAPRPRNHRTWECMRTKFRELWGREEAFLYTDMDVEQGLRTDDVTKLRVPLRKVPTAIKAAGRMGRWMVHDS